MSEAGRGNPSPTVRLPHLNTPSVKPGRDGRRNGGKENKQRKGNEESEKEESVITEKEEEGDLHINKFRGIISNKRNIWTHLFDLVLGLDPLICDLCNTELLLYKNPDRGAKRPREEDGGAAGGEEDSRGGKQQKGLGARELARYRETGGGLEGGGDMREMEDLTGDKKKILEKLMDQDEDEPEPEPHVAIAVVDLLQELTDIDTLHESEEGAEVLIDALLEGQVVALLVQNMERLDEQVKEEADGIYNTLAIIENMAEFRPGLCTEAAQQGLMQWLLKRIKAKMPFDANKLYCSEILAILLQNNDKAYFSSFPLSGDTRELLGEMDGIDVLLQQLSVFKRHNPSTAEEQEMMENLFDGLCSCLMLPANRDRFLRGEGLQLMNLMLREKKMSRTSALKVLDHGMIGPEGADNCHKFVDILGLRTIFPLFMKTPKKMKKTGASEKEHEEHVCSIIASMLRNLKSQQRSRLLNKFTENDCEKVDRLMELHFKYLEAVQQADKRIEGEKHFSLQHSDPGQADTEAPVAQLMTEDCPHRCATGSGTSSPTGLRCKTKEVIVDYRRSRRTEHAPLLIHGEAVERVNNIKFLGIHITSDLTLSMGTAHLEMVRRGEILDDTMEDEFYLRRLDAGLFVLQLICYIMVEISNSGISQILQLLNNCINMSQESAAEGPSNSQLKRRIYQSSAPHHERCSGFLPQSSDMQLMLTGMSKFPEGVSWYVPSFIPLGGSVEPSPISSAPPAQSETAEKEYAESIGDGKSDEFKEAERKRIMDLVDNF
ncbi:hypothetical protein L3Q82_015627 [Scortum barcoo]|uniref:Uncharacterized protein n=1 Tax=Scortum barcoo TaxID=214431 RepID=A0ACB8VNA7_9TELE|nr:hypothetical protein L3Q82_015627 [Scortum barcoo]